MNKLTLGSIKWKEFFIGGENGIFSITSSNSGIDKSKLIDITGKIPYITRSEVNNGINLFVGKEQNRKYRINKGNVISIGLDTQTVFYQPHCFYTGQNIQILENENITKYNALFIIPLLKIQMKKFNWGGNGATLTRLNRTRILLPRDSSGNHPDWQFMSDYMKQKEQISMESILHKLKIQIIEDTIKIKKLSECKWMIFTIGKLFSLYTGKSKGLNHLSRNEINGCSYLGATNRNNGVLCYVHPVDKLIQKGNCIAFIRNGEGSMGYSVYKSESFIATSDITVGYHPQLDRFNGTFITTIADQVRGKYNFGYKRSDTRLSKEKILLPVNSSNEPDFEYMSNYMKKIESEKIKEYLQKKKLSN